MKSLFVRLLIIAAIVVSLPQRLSAQEDVEDYHLYKFYKEDSDLLEWFAEPTDSAVIAQATGGWRRATNWEYQLRMLGYAPRGVSYFESKYLFERVEISSTNSRLLSKLGLRGEYRHDGNYLRSTHHSFHDRVLYGRDHLVGANFSGRNYLMALSHQASYPLSKSDIALDDNWLLSQYVRVNTGRDLYVDGLFSNGAEAALSLSRRWRNNSLIVAAMLPWSQRSVRQATSMEAVTLTQNRGYNPAWGMQNGKMRSSRINSSLTPTLLLSWQRRLGMWTTMQLSAAGSFERRGRTSLAWCDAMTPMPDNYRYLPSYYADDNASRELAHAWRSGDMRYTQIVWDDLYHTNRLQTDGSAAYFVENRRTNNQCYVLNLDLTTQLHGVELEYGLHLLARSDRCFKLADDLLGADHLVDIDYFVRDDATYGTKYRNNIQTDDVVVEQGERFGYDYSLFELMTSLYGVARWRAWDMDFELGVELASSVVGRRGYFEKELFSGSRSYGRSKSVVLYPAKLSLLWDYDFGRNSLNAMMFIGSNTPESENLFLQPQYNNRLVDSPQLSTVAAAEVGYSLLLPKFNFSASLYASYRANGCEVVHYYDDLAQEYVDAVVSGIATLNLGIELEAMLLWSQYFSSQLALNMGRHRYSNDAIVTTYADNDNDLVAVSRSAMRGYNTSIPELSAYADISFRRSQWQATLSLCYVGLRYVNPSFVRRTERIYTYAQSPEEQSALLYQQSLGGAVSLNLSLSRSFRFSGGRWLSVRLTADNLLGANNIGSGYEQNRIRKVVISQREHVRPFANKVTLGYGRTCRINVSFGF